MLFKAKTGLGELSFAFRKIHFLTRTRHFQGDMGTSIGKLTLFSLVRMNFIKIFMEMFHGCLYFVMLRFIFVNFDISVTGLRKTRLLLCENSLF